MSSLQNSSSAVLALLSGASDEHILAGLSVLPRLSPPPSPSDVLEHLQSKGVRFLSRLISTANKERQPQPAAGNRPAGLASKYVSLSSSVLLFLSSGTPRDTLTLLRLSSGSLLPPIVKCLALLADELTCDPAAKERDAAADADDEKEAATYISGAGALVSFLEKQLVAVSSLSSYGAASGVPAADEQDLIAAYYQGNIENEVFESLVKLSLAVDARLKRLFKPSSTPPSAAPPPPSPSTAALSALLDATSSFLVNSSQRRFVQTHVPSTLRFLSESSCADAALKVLQALQYLHSDVPCPAFAIAMESSTSGVAVAVRRLLLQSLRRPPSSSSSSPLSLPLSLLSSLLESFGGKWLLDKTDYEDGTSDKALKALVRVACGELRLQLGMLLERAEEGGKASCEQSKEGEKDDDIDAELRVSIVKDCANIFLNATKHLIALVSQSSDEDLCKTSAAVTAPEADWSSLPFESLLHLQGSLADGFDAMLQFLADPLISSVLPSAPLPSLLSAPFFACLPPVSAWLADSDFDDFDTNTRCNVAQALANAVMRCDAKACDGAADADRHMLCMLPCFAKIFNGRGDVNLEFLAEKMLDEEQQDLAPLFLRYLGRQVENPSSSCGPAATLWCLDVLEGLASFASEARAREVATYLGVSIVPKALQAGAGCIGGAKTFLPHLLRTWFAVVGMQDTPRLNDAVVKNVRTLCEEVLRDEEDGDEGVVRKGAEEVEDDSEYEDDDYDGAVRECAGVLLENGPIFDLCCKASRQYERMSSFIFRKSPA